MAHKCDGCLFKDYYRDMGASTPVCNREVDFIEAIEAFNETTPCRYHITEKEVIQLQNIFFDVIGPHLERIKALEIYQQYKEDWGAIRGYRLYEVDEEIGINGECYSCFDEWYNNDYQQMKGQ